MNKTTCERSSDLVAFLYNEADEHEAREFERHLSECSNCRQEVASFGLVRESITAWREEALSGYAPAAATPVRKSALAALRQFFDLSPLWLKAATGFAVVTFCVLAALAFVKLPNKNESIVSIPSNPAAVYTKQDVERMVHEALAKQESAKQPETAAVVETLKPSNQKSAKPSQVAKSQRPLSRAEREQLAADLRLLSSDDDGLHLLADRINQ